MVHIDPLQDATEALRIAWQGLPGDLSRSLHRDFPEFYGAVSLVIDASGTSHIPPPVLTADERDPETVPSSGIFDTIFDDQPPRHLKDVWSGAGDYDDPLVPQDDHEHELVLARLRAASDKGVDASSPSE